MSSLIILNVVSIRIDGTELSKNSANTLYLYISVIQVYLKRIPENDLKNWLNVNFLVKDRHDEELTIFYEYETIYSTGSSLIGI